MTVRAKFTVQEITALHHCPDGRKIVLRPDYDTSIPEDRRFFDATPTGSMEMFVNNPAVIEEMTLGRAFYVDFTPIVPEADKAA